MVSQSMMDDGWMDSVSLRRFCGKSDVWTDG